MRDYSVNRSILDHHRLAVAGLCLVIAIILVLRCFNAVFYPILYNEDGREILSYFANNPDPSSIFRFYAGYVALLPNTLGYLIVNFFPLTVAPYVMVLVSLGFAITALSLFSLKRFRSVMPDDRSRVVVCLLLALFPLGNHPLLTTLTFCIWNVFVIALLLAVAPLPSARVARVVQFLFMGLAIFSHPFSVLFIPLGLGLFYLRRTWPDRLFQAGIVILAVTYLFVGVRPGPVGSRLNLSSVTATFESIAQRVVFEPVLGNLVRVDLNRDGRSWVVILVAVALLAGAGFLVARGWRHPGLRNRSPVLIFAGFMTLALTGFSVVARANLYESFVDLAWAQRYFLTQQWLFLFVIVSHAVVLTGWSRLPKAARIAVVVLVLAYATTLNLNHRPFFNTSREQGRLTLEFLRDVEIQREYGSGAAGGRRQMVFSRPPEWDIRIDLDESEGP